jgi:hypothetical protein
MPGTAHRIPNDQTFAKWAVIVCAVRADCQQLVRASHEQDLFAVDLSENHLPVAKPLNWKSVFEVHVGIVGI